ncbi:polyamine ABC transporter substrate-binding protein [Pseudomonas sp. 21LCFQ02]|uniref:polyamine ABC transporter substrate-binding protein n=1 Tax=unclassified Pseudomonas TaxID=196821 RepID=UPI0004F84A33|nr:MULTISPECIES: polyamine ABC transporter substrate-binding protein [unclassified Pseudomonas]MCO8171511.1 polyamine ABC transporter substrate-binding protein [Pseudomonas sp. 21LCFQ02]MCQ9427133.1 polyamine ABC transporter substrate-binding protein [Pseudomonas sp. LJDD11]BAP44914.1 putrescine ABC transporter, periplasmic putrescine-binding protein [Pseudomonas sp. StFLB209]
MFKYTMLGLLMAASASHAAGTVNVHNWTDYIADDTLKNFQASTGIKPIYTTFESNEELNGKLLAKGSGYDVVFPSVHFMAQQINAGALKKLDLSQLPNWKNLNPVLLKALRVNDPGNTHGFPYLWGSTGIGYDREQIVAVLGENPPVNSWDLLFKPEYLKKVAQCGVAIIDNAPEMLPIALNYLNLPPHSDVPADYAKAEALLTSVRPYVRYFHLNNYIRDLAAGKICVAVGFSGDIDQAQDIAEKAGHKDILYSVPMEGAPMWFDMVAMPVDAPNEKAAYAYMNYLLRPEVIAAITNQMHYANGNEKADALIVREVWSDKTVYPDDETISRMFVLEPVNPEIDALRNQIWDRIKNLK